MWGLKKELESETRGTHTARTQEWMLKNLHYNSMHVDCLYASVSETHFLFSNGSFICELFWEGWGDLITHCFQPASPFNFPSPWGIPIHALPSPYALLSIHVYF